MDELDQKSFLLPKKFMEPHSDLSLPRNSIQFVHVPVSNQPNLQNVRGRVSLVLTSISSRSTVPMLPVLYTTHSMLYFTYKN